MKVKRCDNYRVEVYPDFSKDADHQKRSKMLDYVCASIRRHIDDVDQVIPTFDIKWSCSFCGWVWEDDPGCCDEAVKEHERLEAEKKAQEVEP